MTITLIATFTALPGHRETVADLVAGFAAAVRREPGNVVFEPFTAVDHGLDFVVYEQYLDEAAFRDHLANPLGGPFNAALAEHIAGDGSVLRFLDPVHVGEPDAPSSRSAHDQLTHHEETDHA